jgi:methionyl-tRNA formyltransferase
MSPIRVCFLGTPGFAETHLQVLLDNPRFEVVGVVTQPDRPAGRKMQLTPSPVKVLAEKKSLPVLTPDNLRKEPEVFEVIKSWKADVAVVVAFGQILSQEFLDSFKHGAVNIHGSLLPLWRGAAPIQRSIEAGDKESGVSMQRMVKKLDAGPVIAEKRVVLDSQITATELYDRLAVLGCELLNVDLVEYVQGNLKPHEQDETLVSVARKIEKEESLLEWNSSAEKLHNKVRAFTMGPGTYVMFQGKRLKIHRTEVVAVETGFNAGNIALADSEKLIVNCADGALSLLEVQPESKSKMPIREFIKSAGLKVGDRFE